MSDSLPSNPDRLTAIRTYLQLQLAHVQAALDAIDTPAPPSTAPPAFVFVPRRHDTPQQRAVDLHTADCWMITCRTQPATPEEARDAIRHGWATACDACQPQP